jgi:N-acetylmuramoyl-L-alanine amidase
MFLLYLSFAVCGIARAGSNRLSSMKDNFLSRLWGRPAKQAAKKEKDNNKNKHDAFVLNSKYKTYKVVLDPGHGGKSQKISPVEGDHWDFKTQKFLTRYNFGAYHDNEAEHKIVLEICQKANEILRSANTDDGWREFSKLLSYYGVKRPEEFRRVNFDISLTRDKSYEAPEHSGEVNVNKHFRLFDSPDSFDENNKPSAALCPGRMSKINAMTPELVICVHINSSTNKAARGQASVIIPDYHVFDFVKTIKSRLGVKKALTYFWVLSWFYPQNSVLSNLSRLINDCETYFTGRRADNKSQIGKRWQMVMWRYDKDDEYDNLLNYKDNDSYWKRERSDYETMRRGGGIIGAGGDNFYASEEVIKFVRMALWQDYINTAGASLKEAYEIKSPGEYLGAHGAPFISDWALPQLVNAVTAYIELGYIENENDRKLLVEKKDIIARAIAVAVYSLTEGYEPKKIPRTKDELLKCNPQFNKIAAAGNAPPALAGPAIKSKAPAGAKAAGKKNSVKQKRINKLVDNIKKELKGGGGHNLKQIPDNGYGEEKIISLTPLVLPVSQRIDFEKYGNYFKSVLKQNK